MTSLATNSWRRTQGQRKCVCVCVCNDSSPSSSLSSILTFILPFILTALALFWLSLPFTQVRGQLTMAYRSNQPTVCFISKVLLQMAHSFLSYCLWLLSCSSDRDRITHKALYRKSLLTPGLDYCDSFHHGCLSII